MVTSGAHIKIRKLLMRLLDMLDVRISQNDDSCGWLGIDLNLSNSGDGLQHSASWEWVSSTIRNCIGSAMGSSRVSQCAKLQLVQQMRTIKQMWEQTM
mmetsp:Transcript_19775/g.37209  ORF Transcript_19775/g.37209 Transcript_19775/m.37209 type:complete len:98 (-) Transcript_19775:187-480(-)